MRRFLGIAVAGMLLAACGSTGQPAASHTQTAAAASSGATMQMPMPAASDAQPHIPGPIPVIQGEPGSSTVNVALTAEVKDIEIAPGVNFHAWTFNGSVPGPVIRVRQGDTLNVTLQNNDPQMSHGVDFHAAQVAPDKNYVAVSPGKSFSFSFKANDVGVFLYHCSVAPMVEHIANGMYGAIIVDPTTPRPPAQEYVIVQGEFYKSPVDVQDMFANLPSYVVFNGYANRYVLQPLTAKPGQLVRLYVVDAGPNRWSAFHVVGTLFSTVEPSGSPEAQLHGLQTWSVAPGDAAMVEFKLQEAGKYPFVSHAMADASMGAMGTIVATPDAPAAGQLAP